MGSKCCTFFMARAILIIFESPAFIIAKLLVAFLSTNHLKAEFASFVFEEIMLKHERIPGPFFGLSPQSIGFSHG